MTSITKAKRTIQAIDKRIDAVRAELKRRRPAFDEMSAFAWQRAWDSYPGLQGIERLLFLRRADAADVRDGLLAKEAKAAERKAARDYRQQAAAIRQASRHACPTCGYEHYAAA